MAKSVLVVEDEPNIVLSLEYVIKKAGYEVRVATPTLVIDAGWVVRGIRKVLELTSWTGKRENLGWL